MASAWLIITEETTARLRELRDRAPATPVDITALAHRLEVPELRELHRAQMGSQTVFIDDGPYRFVVGYSVETGHPVGTCRHMSMSVVRDGRVPHPAGIWIIAEIMGFTLGLDQCVVWPEDLRDGGKAVNLLQPLEPDAEWIAECNARRGTSP